MKNGRYPGVSPDSGTDINELVRYISIYFAYNIWVCSTSIIWCEFHNMLFVFTVEE